MSAIMVALSTLEGTTLDSVLHCTILYRSCSPVDGRVGCLPDARHDTVSNTAKLEVSVDLEHKGPSPCLEYLPAQGHLLR